MKPYLIQFLVIVAAIIAAEYILSFLNKRSGNQLWDGKPKLYRC